MTAIGGAAWTGAYDSAGDLTCRAPSSATTCAGTQTGAQLSYDNAGQLATWQNTPANPTTTASYLYDGEGHRVQQVVTSGGATTTTTYVGALEELSTTGATTTTTAYYGGIATSVNGTLAYTLADGLGSVSAALSTSGLVTAVQLYGPYGAVRYSSGALPGSLGYTGQHADAATGLDYYGARYYDPEAGQFTSADSTLAGGLNRYAYVSGNPETYTDPTGHIEGEGGGDSGELSDAGGSGDGQTSGVDASGSSGPSLETDLALPPTKLSDGQGGYDVTYGEGDGAVTITENADGQVTGGVDDAGKVETNAEIDAEQADEAKGKINQSDHSPSDEVRQSGDRVKAKSDQVRAQNQARNPNARGPAYGQVTIENADTGAVIDQSGVYKGEGRSGTNTHAEVQGTNYAKTVMSTQDASDASHVQVTISVGRPFCPGCTVSQLGGYAAGIQAAAPEGIQVDVAFYDSLAQYIFFGAP